MLDLSESSLVLKWSKNYLNFNEFETNDNEIQKPPWQILMMNKDLFP